MVLPLVDTYYIIVKQSRSISLPLIAAVSDGNRNGRRSSLHRWTSAGPAGKQLQVLVATTFAGTNTPSASGTRGTAARLSSCCAMRSRVSEIIAGHGTTALFEVE